MNDTQLLNRLKQRDQLALKQAIDQYQAMVFKIAIGFTHDQQTAQDIVQDVFIKLWENAPRLELKNTKLSTWLYKVTVNHCINLSRKEKFKSFVEEISNLTRVTDDGAVEIQIEDTSTRSPQQILENEQLKQILKKAIDQLPRKQRIAFILSKYQNLSSKEIAEIMDTTPGNVDVILHRAKKNLQKNILKLSNNELQAGQK